MTKSNKINWTKWSVILGVPGVLLTGLSLYVYLNSKELKCTIVRSLGIKAEECATTPTIATPTPTPPNVDTKLTPNISVVKLRILNESGDGLESVKVILIGSDTVEPVYTDRDGLIESKIENEGSIKATVSAKGYPTTTQILTTKVQPLVIKEMRISSNGNVTTTELSSQDYDKIRNHNTTPVNILPSTVSLLDKATWSLPVASNDRTLFIKLRIIAEINQTSQRATFALFDGNTGVGGCTVSYTGSTSSNGSSHTNECAVQYDVPANKQVVFKAQITPSNETLPSPDPKSPFNGVTVTNADILSISTK